MEIIGKFLSGFSFTPLETKENQHCYKHKLDFTSELLQLPSGKTKWTGCNRCQEEEQKQREINAFKQHMQDCGMKFDREKKQWFKHEVIPDSNTPPNLNISYRKK